MVARIRLHDVGPIKSHVCHEFHLIQVHLVLWQLGGHAPILALEVLDQEHPIVITPNSRIRIDQWFLQVVKLNLIWMLDHNLLGGLSDKLQTKVVNLLRSTSLWRSPKIELIMFPCTPGLHPIFLIIRQYIRNTNFIIDVPKETA